MTTQIAIIQKVEEIQNKISLYQSDLFIGYAEYLYKLQGYDSLNDYYSETKKFKNDLDEILLDYYTAIDFNDIQEQQTLLMDIIYLVDNYKINILNISGNKETYCNYISEYFRDKKDTLSNLDHTQNDNSIVSRIQQEWAIRLYKLDEYYKIIAEENSACLEKKNKGMISNFLEYFSKSKKPAVCAIEYV